MKKTLALLMIVLGCSPSTPSSDDGGPDASTDVAADAPNVDLTGLCPTQHTEPRDGGTWVVCDSLYATPPFIRPPADTATSFFVGFKFAVGDGGASFEMMGRGQTWPEPTGFTGAIEGNTAGEAPYGYTLYEATIANGNVTALQPVARISENLFLQPFAGAVVEGSLSPRVVAADGGVSFDYTNLDVPVRIQVGSTVGAADAGTFNHPFLPATIENVDAGVMSASGTCIPALTSAGAANPVSGATDPGGLAFVRQPNMHGGHDDVIVMIFSSTSLGTTMTPSGFVSVADLLQNAPLDLSQFGGGFTHGTPSESPSATTFATVTDGGAPCP